MIIADIYAGMGNQMFQYAFARALQERTGEKMIMNGFSAIRINDIRRYSLHHFKLSPKAKYPPYPIQMFYDFFGKLKRRIYCKNNQKILFGKEILLKMIDKGMYVSRDVYNYYDLPISKKRNKYIIGFWQSPKYFSHIEQKIKEEFTVTTPPSAENAEMLEKIKSTDSVCVHIRRGDYLKYKELDICTEDYYLKAMDIIADKVGNPVFYIFSYNSEDIKYIKDNFKFKYNVEYIDLNNPDYEELRLMYSCKHFIISNSTFSWWAQYLGRDDNKIVVAPSEWNREECQDASGMYIDSWHTVEV